MKKLVNIAAAITAALMVSACQTTTPEDIKPYISVVTPSQDVAEKPYPVVFFLQGTGGGNIRADYWAAEFKKSGIASVAVNSAGMRGLQNLSTVDASRMTADYAAALTALENDPRLDLSRHAVMGFSRGGSAAMIAGSALRPEQPAPKTVIAFYPGLPGDCSSNHKPGTDVHIFYGSLDQWGNFRGIRSTCEMNARSNPNVHFHLLQGAHHGFDMAWSGTWRAGNQNFRSEGNSAITAEVGRTLTRILSGSLR